jgi:hypothetical protein
MNVKKERSRINVKKQRSRMNECPNTLLCCCCCCWCFEYCAAKAHRPDHVAIAGVLGDMTLADVTRDALASSESEGEGKSNETRTKEELERSDIISQHTSYDSRNQINHGKMRGSNQPVNQPVEAQDSKPVQSGVP